tara:strand:+ start:484 stop:585 length:102 start_codon:yes stop_codon:yes gene_type:complete
MGVSISVAIAGAGIYGATTAIYLAKKRIQSYSF